MLGTGVEGEYGKFSNQKDLELTIMGIAKDVEYIKVEIARISERQERCYVTKEEFDPVKKLAYGAAGLLLTGILLALFALVIVK